MKSKDAFREIVASLLNSADAKLDLRASPIETFEPFQYFGPELFEAQHGANGRSKADASPADAILSRVLVKSPGSIEITAYVQR